MAHPKLEEIIENGRSVVPSVLQGISNEYESRKDWKVPVSRLGFEVGDDGSLGLNMQNGETHKLRLTKHSVQQVFDRTNVPKGYYDQMIKKGAVDLARQNLAVMAEKSLTNGVLVRQVGDVAKGFLSPSYRPINAAPVFQQFLESTTKSGYVPYTAHNTDYRYQIRMIWPEIFTPSPNEQVIFGMSITTGDYGSQAMALELVILRLLCSNGMIGSNLFRKIHLGARFDNGDEISAFSDRTYELDTKTIGSAINDLVLSHNDRFKVLSEVIASTDGKEFDEKKALESLRKSGMGKDMAEKVQQMYDAPMPVEVLPQQKGAWRFANTLSFMAHDKELSGDSVIDLEGQAMKVLLDSSDVKVANA